MECIRCGYKFSDNRAQCPSCKKFHGNDIIDAGADIVALSEVDPNTVTRIATGPWDACFGKTMRGKNAGACGIVTCMVYLIGGFPGAGKSTLSIQLADNMIEATGRPSLYIGTEQSLGETRILADDLGLENTHKILMMRRPEKARGMSPVILQLAPSLIILDSLPGLIGNQLQESIGVCATCKGWAVDLRIPVIIIDHINGEKELAGLMALQHAVDAIITFSLSKKPKEAKEGIRVLRTEKNRNGIAPLEIRLRMTELGLQAIEERT